MSTHDDKLDKATADRLGKLASMPVDMSGLEQNLAGALPPKPSTKLATRPSPYAGWLRVAAVLALMVGIAGASYYAFFGVAPQTAVAQTMTVAELHEHLLADPQSAYITTTTNQAQRLIDAQLAGDQPLPIIQGTRVESCCLVEGEFPLRAALVIKQPAGNATLIIAQGEDFAMQMHPIDHPSGLQLQGHDHAGMPMVMRNVGDLWMCVMGDLDESELADIAAKVNF